MSENIHTTEYNDAEEVTAEEEAKIADLFASAKEEALPSKTGFLETLEKTKKEDGYVSSLIACISLWISEKFDDEVHS